MLWQSFNMSMHWKVLLKCDLHVSDPWNFPRPHYILSIISKRKHFVWNMFSQSYCCVACKIILVLFHVHLAITRPRMLTLSCCDLLVPAYHMRTTPYTYTYIYIYIYIYPSFLTPYTHIYIYIYPSFLTPSNIPTTPYAYIYKPLSLPHIHIYIYIPLFPYPLQYTNYTICIYIYKPLSLPHIHIYIYIYPSFLTPYAHIYIYTHLSLPPPIYQASEKIYCTYIPTSWCRFNVWK